MNELIGGYLLFAGFAFPSLLFLYLDMLGICKKLEKNASEYIKTFEIQKQYRMLLEQDVRSLRDELTDIKHIDESKIDQITKQWIRYKAFLMDKYPVEEGQEWEFKCEHHKKIEEILHEPQE